MSKESQQKPFIYQDNKKAQILNVELCLSEYTPILLICHIHFFFLFDLPVIISNVGKEDHHPYHVYLNEHQ